jgi:hypothetical protein
MGYLGNDMRRGTTERRVTQLKHCQPTGSTTR